MRGGTQYRLLLPAIRISRLLAAAVYVALMAVPAGAAENSPPEAVEGAPAYVRFDPIFIPVIEGNRVTRQVGVTLMLELIDAKSKSDVEAKRKLLVDAFFKDLYSFFQTRAGAQSRVDQSYLKTRLLRIASRVTGPDVVKEVLIEQFFERKK